MSCPNRGPLQLKVGDYVARDEPVMMVETDKTTVPVNAPEVHRLTGIIFGGPFRTCFPSPPPPHTRCVMCPAQCPCLPDADWCLQSDVMTNSCLQGGIVTEYFVEEGDVIGLNAPLFVLDTSAEAPAASAPAPAEPAAAAAAAAPAAAAAAPAAPPPAPKAAPAPAPAATGGASPVQDGVTRVKMSRMRLATAAYGNFDVILTITFGPLSHALLSAICPLRAVRCALRSADRVPIGACNPIACDRLCRDCAVTVL